jgi:hypothetical protein
MAQGAQDDIIDAAVMLVTAMRLEAGEAARLPKGSEQRDERGLLMEMWAQCVRRSTPTATICGCDGRKREGNTRGESCFDGR